MNVYEDLNYPDAESMFIKAGLMVRIQRAIHDGGLDLATAARRMQIEADLLAEYLDGQFQDATFDQLVQYLNRLGQDVEIVVTPKPSDQAQAKVTFRDGREQAAA